MLPVKAQCLRGSCVRRDGTRARGIRVLTTSLGHGSGSGVFNSARVPDLRPLAPRRRCEIHARDLREDLFIRAVPCPTQLIVQKRGFNMLLRRLHRAMPLYPILGLLGAYTQAISYVPVCNSSIYCSGELLERVQLARIFKDAKTFVDLKLVYTPAQTETDFAKLLNDTNQNPSRDQIQSFVNSHFTDGNELDYWNPPDFDPEPPLLNQISDPKLREFAKDVIAIWKNLGRKVNPDVVKQPDQYSFIYIPNGFIIPGGRFKEMYYWDSFWVIRGLIICNMMETAKGMIENLLYQVEKFGYIPNGSRIYYMGRSQPPLLTAMVSSYFAATQDFAWLKRVLPTVEKEIHYWLDHKKINVEVKGKKHVLLRYFSDPEAHGPRPESFIEDYEHALLVEKDKREDFYVEIRSAAETGWDFSSRWFCTENDTVVGNITNVRTTRIIPVDLNSIFAGSLEMVGDFRYKLKDKREAQKWWSLAKYWRIAIDNVLWDEKDGVWYDYDILAKNSRRYFYPSCASPLWAGAVEKGDLQARAASLVKYLQSSGSLDFPGGVPTSLVDTSEQWDFPNAWPPLQSILIGGLDMSGHEEAKKLAKEIANNWIRSNYLGYVKYRNMFEKYNVLQPGEQGGGGEYVVQTGFGWTNGIALELLQKYGKEMAVYEEATQPIVRLVA